VRFFNQNFSVEQWDDSKLVFQSNAIGSGYGEEDGEGRNEGPILQPNG
jgi:hypothetical protein